MAKPNKKKTITTIENKVELDSVLHHQVLQIFQTTVVKLDIEYQRFYKSYSIHNPHTVALEKLQGIKNSIAKAEKLRIEVENLNVQSKCIDALAVLMHTKAEVEILYDASQNPLVLWI